MLSWRWLHATQNVAADYPLEIVAVERKCVDASIARLDGARFIAERVAVGGWRARTDRRFRAGLGAAPHGEGLSLRVEPQLA
jgi:hypothetical protein